ncbi:MAG: cytochrome c553 [Parasphingorhabdus sp.]|jgi:cytochrome c553
MKRIMLIASLASSLVLATSAMAGGPGDAAAGKEKAVMCTACHNADGNSTTTIYPIIAGQYRDYLAQALTDYRDGGRNNPIMKGFAAALNDEDILNLSAYFSKQESNLKTPDPE